MPMRLPGSQIAGRTCGDVHACALVIRDDVPLVCAFRMPVTIAAGPPHHIVPGTIRDRDARTAVAQADGSRARVSEVVEIPTDIETDEIAGDGIPLELRPKCRCRRRCCRQ